MVNEQKHKHRKWQNLLYKKCPNCGSKLETRRDYLVCPNISDTDKNKNCFFIKETNAMEILLDPKHPANYCLTFDERERITEIFNSTIEL